jgi:HlyD family secretion protein
MMKKKALIVVALLLVVGAGLFLGFRGTGNGQKFKTVRVSTGNVRATVTATGTLNAVITVLVGTQVSGMVKKLHADFNSPVKAGQVIAEIDPATFEAQVDNVKANLLQAKAMVEKDKAALADATRIRDRNRQLFDKALIARADLDTSEATHDVDEAQLHSDMAQISQTEAQLRLAETNLRYTKIVSPVDGTVVSRNVDVGQTVAASFQTPTLFTIAQDLTKMQVDTNVDEADVGRVSLGQDVEFNVDAYPDRIFRGKVSQIRIAPITVQNVVTYDVVITLDNGDLRLKPGMTANVSIIVANKSAVLKVPNAALRFRPSDKDLGKSGTEQSTKEGGQPGGPPNAGGAPRREGAPQGGQPGGGPAGATPAGQRSYAIWILEQSKPKRVPITVGISDGMFTEVTGGDLKEGQEVILESLGTAKKNNTAQQGAPRFIR